VITDYNTDATPSRLARVFEKTFQNLGLNIK